MKISAIYSTHDPVNNEFALFKECGFDACDFSLGGLYGKSDEELFEHCDAIRKSAESVGFEIGQTHSDFSGHPRDYYYDYDEIVDRQITSIKATHWLGAKNCIIHPVILPGRRYELLLKESLEKTIEFYKRLTPYLEEYDVYCCVENMWVVDPVHRHICPTTFSRAQEMVDVCNILGDRFKICVDTGHGEVTGDDPVEMIRIAGDKLYALHTHDTDCRADLHTLPFMSHQIGKKDKKCDYEEMMKALDEVGYKGNLNFEIGMPGPNGIRRAGLVYLARVGKYLASLRKGE